MKITREPISTRPICEDVILGWIKAMARDKGERISSGDTLVVPGIEYNSFDVYRLTQRYKVKK